MSIQAIDPTSSKWKQDSEHGTSTAAFLIWRSGDTTQALTVTYTVEGDAVPGSDYAALSGSVTIPAGEIAASILVTPTDNASTIRSATLTVVLDWSFEYEGGWSEASVAINESYGAHDGIIENSWEKPEVSFSTLDPYAAELPDGPTSTGLIVLFRLSIGEGDHSTDPPTITFQTCTDSVDVEYSVE